MLLLVTVKNSDSTDCYCGRVGSVAVPLTS